MPATRPARSPIAPRVLQPVLLRRILPLALAAGALAGGALPARLAAQGPTVTVGATVRVLSPVPGASGDAPGPEAWHQGRVLNVDASGLSLRTGGRDQPPYTIPRDLVRRVEVRAHAPGRAGRGLGFGALGGLVGAVIGGFIGSAATQCTACDSPGMGALLGVPLGGLVGVVGGAVVGANTGGRWVPAALPAPAAPPAATTPPSAPAPDGP
jgi:hypothetical protein